MKRLFSFFFIVSICVISCAQQTNAFDIFLKKIPELHCPIDIRKFDYLFVKNIDSDGNLELSFNYDEIKKHKVYKSLSFKIEELNQPFNYNTDGFALICPLAYIDGRDYKIVLYLNDEYRNEDYVCITAILYTNEGDFLFEDENSSKSECRMAHYCEDGYYEYYTIFENVKRMVHYGKTDTGDYNSITTISNDGLNFNEINSDQ